MMMMMLLLLLVVVVVMLQLMRSTVSSLFDFRVSRSVFRNGTMQKQSKKADDPHNKSNVPMIIGYS